MTREEGIQEVGEVGPPLTEAVAVAEERGLDWEEENIGRRKADEDPPTLPSPTPGVNRRALRVLVRDLGEFWGLFFSRRVCRAAFFFPATTSK